MMEQIVVFVVGIFLLLTSFASAAPVAYWNFNECNGTIATDSTGNGNTGTLQNGARWTEGRSGCAIDLDGTDDFVFVPDAPALDITQKTRGYIRGRMDQEDHGLEDRFLQNGVRINGVTPFI